MALTMPQQTFAAGAVLFYERDEADVFFIVLAGEVAILKALGTADERLTQEDQIIPGTNPVQYRVGNSGYGFMSNIRNCAQLLNTTISLPAGPAEDPSRVL